MRMSFARLLLDRYPVAVLRGNLSEALAVLERPHRAIGVDAGDELDAAARAEVAQALARCFHTVGAVSGCDDAVADCAGRYVICGGSQLMGTITGTGCMQGALIAACAAVAEPLEAAQFGSLLMARAGEVTADGPMELRLRLIDWVYGAQSTVLDGLDDRIQLLE